LQAPGAFTPDNGEILPGFNTRRFDLGAGFCEFDLNYRGSYRATGGMLKIGYVRLRDQRSADDTATLKMIGCHVVRAEEPMGPVDDESEVLNSILDFIGAGDQLVVTRLEQLGGSTRAALDIIDRLEDRGASLYVAEQEISSQGLGGRALRAALNAVMAVEPIWSNRKQRRGPPAADEIRALQAAGVGPVEIARRLGVSRMTVWRKLKGGVEA
jgi:DNA invertase Pin-like site-specific DNA recombinase